MAWHLFDYIDLRDKNAVTMWLESLDAMHQAKVKAKLLSIRMFGSANELPGMVTDTVERHIKEIVINSKTLALRLFLCRGPLDVRTSLTFLGGGREKNSKYISGANLIDPAEAELRRKMVFNDPVNRRRQHEYYKEFLG